MIHGIATFALAVGMAASAAVAGVTHDAPEGGFNGHLGTLPPGHGKPDNVPEFRPHPGCTPEIRLADRLLVVDQDGRYREMAFDEATRRIENAAWVDDVWVVGTC